MPTFAPLDGLRVLDFTRVLAGPQCTQYLAELGAEVTKVEAIGTGDDTRHWPPFEGGTGAVFLSANRGKRSIALDLASPEGRAVCHRLAAGADVVVESFGPGVAARLGVDHATLSALNPRLIHCSVTGYGSVGPMRDAKGYDVIAQAFCGMLSITGEPGGPPVRSPFSPVDQGTGLHAVVGILGAVLQRERTGRGCRVETSLFDTAVGFLAYFLQSFWARGTEPVRAGSGHESLCPYQVFEAQDRPLILGVANDALWVAFCRAAGVPALATHDAFLTNARRVERRAETVSIVAAVLRTRTRDDWLARLDAAGIPCSPVHTLGELCAHPHTHESGMVFDTLSPAGRPLRAVSVPLRIDGERLAPRRPVPGLGEDTDAVLREAGYTDEEIGALAARRVVARAGGVG